MGRRRLYGPEEKLTKRPPAATPEGRENQMVSLAVELAEKQLIDGTATSQVIAHYLKLGSSREKLEQERLVHENELLKVKSEAIASSQRVEELYTIALNAMRSYAGQDLVESETEYEN